MDAQALYEAAKQYPGRCPQCGGELWDNGMWLQCWRKPGWEQVKPKQHIYPEYMGCGFLVITPLPSTGRTRDDDLMSACQRIASAAR